MNQPIRVAFIGAVRRTTECNFWEMAKNYSGIFHITKGFESAAFDHFDPSQTYLAGGLGERRVVFFTDDKTDPVAVVAAVRQRHAKVFVFSEAYSRGAEEVLPDDRAPEATPGKPLIFALDSVSVENIWRLLA